MATTPQLPPEVAEHFELSDAGHTRLFVPRLDREVDLTKVTVAEAEELLALPGGFQWLRRRPVPVVVEEIVPAASKRTRRAR